MKTYRYLKNLMQGMVVVALAFASPFTDVALAADEITVAYFLEWPTPNQVAQIDETFDKELGVKLIGNPLAAVTICPPRWLPVMCRFLIRKV